MNGSPGRTGAILRHVRKGLEVSEEDSAAAFGVSLEGLRRIESGEEDVEVSALRLWAKRFATPGAVWMALAIVDELAKFLDEPQLERVLGVVMRSRVRSETKRQRQAG